MLDLKSCEDVVVMWMERLWERGEEAPSYRELGVWRGVKTPNTDAQRGSNERRKLP